MQIGVTQLRKLPLCKHSSPLLLSSPLFLNTSLLLSPQLSIFSPYLLCSLSIPTSLLCVLHLLSLLCFNLLPLSPFLLFLLHSLLYSPFLLYLYILLLSLNPFLLFPLSFPLLSSSLFSSHLIWFCINPSLIIVSFAALWAPPAGHSSALLLALYYLPMRHKWSSFTICFIYQTIKRGVILLLCPQSVFKVQKRLWVWGG